MLKVIIDYPKLEEEKKIIRQNITGEKIEVRPILKATDIMEARKVVRQVYLDEKIEQYLSVSYTHLVQVILECTEMKDSGMPGTSRYITTKNRKNTTERLELKKYNPILKRVTVHKEIK